MLAKAAADKHAFFPTVISVLATVAAANVSSKEGTYSLNSVRAEIDSVFDMISLPTILSNQIITSPLFPHKSLLIN